MHRHRPYPHGSIEVIAGSMFSGKSEELIRRIKRAQIAKLKIKIFKPSVDIRYSETQVASHSNQKLDAIAVKNSSEILLHSEDCEIIGVDEVQFFDDNIVNVLQTLADQGKRVVVSGLDSDYKRAPFGVMPALMAIAEDVTKLHAVCNICHGEAQFTNRFSGGDSQFQLGASDSYQPLCRSCFVNHNPKPCSAADNAISSDTKPS